MKRNEKEAIKKMAESLTRTAVNNIDFEISLFNECGLLEFDTVKVQQEAEYIHNLQQLAEQVNNIEDDELEDWDITDFDLEFLKNDFSFNDIVEMVEDENIAKEIWDAIYAKAEVTA